MLANLMRANNEWIHIALKRELVIFTYTSSTLSEPQQLKEDPIIGGTMLWDEEHTTT